MSLTYVRAGLVPYPQAWEWQRRLHARRVAGEIGDTCLLLEHPSVYTAGRRTEEGERPASGVEVLDVDRGGKITWHGPGQLVGYPIVSLEPVVDVVAHVRRVEAALIDVCAERVAAERVEGRSGVWVKGGRAKVAAIGVRVAQGVTMHGFALNADPDLSAYAEIVPCGIRDAGVTSLSVLLERPVTVAEVLALVEASLARALGHLVVAHDTAGALGLELALVSDAAPGGRRLLRLEVRNAETPIERKPPWLKVRASMGPDYREIRALVEREGLHTVCQEAGCPNIYECWEDREATFLIGGDQCTRRCDFCQIDTGKPAPLDRDEPRRVAESVATMQLRYATITGVARDDLDDGGAWLYAETVRQIHALNPGCGVELLIPDFRVDAALLAQVFDSAPEVLAHNVETVPRLFREIRPAFTYAGSLAVITRAAEAGLVTKSNLILGMGETREEVGEALRDLRSARCDLLTITQYLRPTPRHHPVVRFVRPEEFVELRAEAEGLGFLGVQSGPLVRSSYRAGRLYQQAVAARAATP